VSGTTPTTAPVASPASVLPEVPRLPDRHVDQLAFPRRETYKQMVAAFRDAGFELCSDLCAVDYLSHPGRSLPEGVTAERFEVRRRRLDVLHPGDVAPRVEQARPAGGRVRVESNPVGAEVDAVAVGEAERGAAGGGVGGDVEDEERGHGLPVGPRVPPGRLSRSRPSRSA